MAEIGDSRLENVVEYQIFDIRSFCNEETEPCDIQGTLYDILSYSQSLIEDYIWQNDPFNLRLHEQFEESNDGERIPCLQGSTNFGDNIEDEWFIVFLLFAISEKFPHVVARVKDNDGEFLLIEAADYLPKWLEPDTSENRVFLYQGKVHIIPLPRTPSEIAVFPVGKLTIFQALKILKSNPEKTIAFPWVQDAVLRKVQEYPSKAKSSFHHVLCYLPVSLKYLLKKRPSLIAPAVLAFVNSDPIDVKSCQKLRHFSFESPVPYRVCFTKCLYGQLVKQNFIPEKSTLKLLPEVSSASYKGHILGIQLTYGFEILYSQQQAGKNGMPETTSPRGHQWEKYLDALKRNGYFKGELEGSKLYVHLLQNAEEYFSRNCSTVEGTSSNYNEIQELLQDMPSNDEMPLEDANEIPPDDDESWLEISPEQLESMLSQYGCEMQLNSSDVDLNKVVQGMNSFVENVSGYEGAEFPSGLDDEVEIQFDPEDFVKSIDSLLKPRYTVGRSEEGESGSSDNDSAVEDEEYDQYKNAMDEELSATHIGNSFVKMTGESDHVNDDETGEKKESEMKPVDIDLNLVQNFLESYSLQEGVPGPVSNILNSMGIPLPPSCAESD